MLADPSHNGHQEMLEWLSIDNASEFDPAAETQSTTNSRSTAPAAERQGRSAPLTQYGRGIVGEAAFPRTARPRFRSLSSNPAWLTSPSVRGSKRRPSRRARGATEYGHPGRSAGARHPVRDGSWRAPYARNVPLVPTRRTGRC